MSSCYIVICPDVILSSGFLDIILSQANKILVLSPICKKSGPIWMTVKVLYPFLPQTGEEIN